MEFRIADTFTDSLARLPGQEQKLVKTTAFDLQTNPSGSGMQFHRIDKARDPNFWSIRASSDLRIIVHKTGSSLTLCYVDHHEQAYDWARRRKLEVHPTTGAAQLVEIRETVKDIVIPRYVEAEAVAEPKPALFADVEEEELLRYGVPPAWLADVFKADENTLLDLADHLPAEAAEALLDLAVGVKPQVAQPVAAGADPFAHPDAQRRFRIMANAEELERALDAPWEKWTVFLHPTQRELVERSYSGPARVSGSAGTGKTIVALHRAVHLARKHADARVLLTTFSEPLANALRTRLRRLVSNEPRIAERLEVHALSAIGERLYELNIGTVKTATPAVVRKAIETAAAEVEVHRFGLRFLFMEWEQVVDAWRLSTWDEYRDVRRLGRKTRISEAQRATLWSIFERVRKSLAAQNLLTYADVFTQLATCIAREAHVPFDYIVVDEAQDLTIAQLRFLAACGADRPDALFFAGDLGQRIFQQPFSWKAVGVDIRGRSRTLRVNYRTSHQIRTQADRLLDPELTDVDGNVEERRGTVSVFNGPKPVIQVCATPEAECEAATAWLKERIAEGVQPHEIGIFVRSGAQLDRAKAAAKAAALPYKVLDETVDTKHGFASVATMHLAKGLEFRAIAVMACDDEILPLQERIETVADTSDLEDVYNTERQLLYVACTRAREHLLVTAAEPASEFVDDLRGTSIGV